MADRKAMISLRWHPGTEGVRALVTLGRVGSDKRDDELWFEAETPAEVLRKITYHAQANWRIDT